VKQVLDSYIDLTLPNAAALSPWNYTRNAAVAERRGDSKGAMECNCDAVLGSELTSSSVNGSNIGGSKNGADNEMFH
jgi:hypothetical protein